MNGVGRQGQRSGAAGVHHQRQYSDNFLETSSNGRWLQSAGLQHLNSSSLSVPPLQVLPHLSDSFPMEIFRKNWHSYTNIPQSHVRSDNVYLCVCFLCL